MNLIVPGIGTEASPTWASDLNADLVTIDSHNHSSGQGVQITPSGLNINADLAFQNNNATLLRSTRFQVQNSVLSLSTDVGCLYVVGNELYYNDVTGGHNVQLTANGVVNATSSGISSGTASAAFSAGVLVVKSTSTSGANILMQSAVLTNSGNLTNQLTVAAPSLSGSGTITLPAIPGAQSFMTIDASGNMAAYAPVAQGITRSNLVPVGQQVSSSSGSFLTSSTSFVNVTNLNVTITTTGRPVMVFLTSDGSGNVANISNQNVNDYVIIEITGGAKTYITNFGGAANTAVPSSSVQFFDTPSAGTYTYQVQMKSQSGGAQGLINSVLVAYELK